MPTYDYFCPECKAHFQAYHAINAEFPVCGVCGGTPSRVILTAPAVHDHMARGREAAVHSLEPQVGKTGHGPGCSCCH